MKKQHSIKTIFTLYFTAAFAAILLVLYIFSRFFMQAYYQSEKVRILGVAYETLDKLVEMAEDNDESIFDLIIDEYDSSEKDSPAIAVFRTLNERSNIDIAMMSSDGRRRAATSREADWLLMKLDLYRNYLDESNVISDTDVSGDGENINEDLSVNIYSEAGISPDQDDAEFPEGPLFTDRASDPWWAGGLLRNDQQYRVIKTTDNYIIHIVEDFRSGSQYIECLGIFSDYDTFFLMSMPLSNISEGVNVATRFLFITGLMGLMIGALIMYFVAWRVTKPIIKLSKLSDKMASLNFEDRYDKESYRVSYDEINDLGNSMNSMAEMLEAYIGELKEANARLQNDIEEKIRIDEARKEFIANVSHELKTPIALIEGYAEGLVEGLAEDKDSRDYYCNVIMDEAVKMNRMVRELTSLISYEFGNNTPDLTDFNICDLIRSVTESLSIKLEEKGAKLKTELPESLMVRADEFKIEEVYTNYLNNAMNHLDGERHITVRAVEDDKRITVYVYNDGMPIPEESIPHLWEKFYKVDKARTRAYGGSGIGLSIVKAIMDAHGGGYGVINKEHGVEFYFYLNKVLDDKKNV